MQANGIIGHSEAIGFFSDGDGDFRPKFNFDIDVKKVKPYKLIKANGDDGIDIYDAG